MNSKTCIVLAGGLGTRLRSVLADVPKCMAPVGDKPFLQILLESLVAKGFEHFIFSLGYKAEVVISYLASSSYSQTFTYECIVENEQLGTGGAIRYAMNMCNIDQAAVVNGDTLITGDFLSDALEFLYTESKVKMLAIEVDDRSRFGGVTFKDDKLISFLEKGDTGPGVINAGIYNVKRSSFDVIPLSLKSFSFEVDVLPALISSLQVEVITVAAAFIDIGVPDDYYKLVSDYS